MIRDIPITVRVLTPLHIGTGRKLVKDFDFFTRNNRTYRIREEGLIDELYARDPKLTEQLMRTPPGQLLKSEDLREGSPLIRYVLPGEPSGQEFREAIKDPYDRPYIPGSSLKGALRTLIAWHAWKELRLSLPRSSLKGRAKFAAKELEKKIFGPDPNQDLLRALRVSDSKPASTDVLEIHQVKVWTPRGGAAPISVEAIKPGTVFRAEITFDVLLFAEWSSKAQGFPLPHQDWLEAIPRLAKVRASERFKGEFEFWQRAGFKEVPYRVLTRINELQKAEEGFPLQLGFGTGWGGTTIGEGLKADPIWRDVHRRHGLGKAPRSTRQTPPERFPASRRVVVNQAGKPMAPLGWVWIKWEEEGR